MKKINIKDYILNHKIRSTLFILKTTKCGCIPDGTKRTIRKLRNKVGNVRFILLSEKIPPIKETFDLVITDEISSSLVEKVKKIVKFNHLLVVYKGHIFDTHKNNNYKTIEIPLTQESDLNQIVELQRLRKKQTTAQLAGKKVGLYVGVALIAAVMLVPSLMVAIVLGQYNPTPVLDLEIKTNRSEKVQYNTRYSALSYNTGFAGYNQDMHFYMDCPGQKIWGGQGTCESKESTFAGLDGVKRILTTQDHDTAKIVDSDQDVKSYELKGSRIYSTTFQTEDQNEKNYRNKQSDTYIANPSTYFKTHLNDAGDGLFDFVALQEQDTNCPKSYNTNQPQIIADAEVIKDNTTYKWSDLYNSTYAINFSTPFIPIPLNDIYGKTFSGLSTFSKYYNAKAQRYSLANIKTFPLNLFEMKRCLSMNWFPIGDAKKEEDHKYFVFINAHLAAYDSGGSVRREQLGQLNQWLSDLENNGHYFMVAADWNQILPDTRGYEGNDALKSETEEKGLSYPNDNAIMGWDFEDFKDKTGNTKNPNLETDYMHPEEWSENKTYKKDDVVYYEYKGTVIPESFADLEPNIQAANTGHSGALTQYMASVKKHNYQAMVDNPTEPPVDPNTGIKSSQWRYSLSNSAVYRDASLNDYVRNTLLPIAFNKDALGDSFYYSANANFYTTHAIPTLRNAGVRFRNESKNANLYDKDHNLLPSSHGYCYKASIDGFLVSKNIRVYETYGIDTNFKYSDHNPVGITFEFIEKEE